MSILFLKSSAKTLLLSLMLFTCYSPLTHAEAADPEPLAIIKNIVSSILETMKQQRQEIMADPQTLYQITDQHLVPHVDITTMSRLVLAQHWRAANDAHRQRFATEFLLLLQRFYVNALMENPQNIDAILNAADSLISYKPLQIQEDSRDLTIRADVKLPSGMIVPVGFSMLRDKAGVWKIYDVVVEGGSLIINYRASFGSEIQRDGLEATLKRMQATNVELLQKQAQLQ
ncbi:MAG: ABC transporter substrate-binding protein [Gammaproteobacteria bacterium]|nr:ABC transporter substrate-binding protein [Gammaproteobacteria bacterium]